MVSLTPGTGKTGSVFSCCELDYSRYLIIHHMIKYLIFHIVQFLNINLCCGMCYNLFWFQIE